MFQDLLSRVAELKECDPVCHSLAHLGSSGVGEGHQEHHRGPGLRVLLQCRDRLDGENGEGFTVRMRFWFFRIRILYFEASFVELQPHCHVMGLNRDKCGCSPTVQRLNLTNNFKVTTGLYSYN